MTVALVGIGTVGPSLADEHSIPELVLEAVEAALADAHLTRHDVDAVVTASVDLLDGLTASNIAVTEVVGAVMKPETRIAADGLAAAIHAACLVRAGAYETVLVAAHGKASLTPTWELTSWAMDPVYLQPLGIDFLVCAGLQASALAAEDDAAEERWARLASQRLREAAPAGTAVPSADEVLASPVIALPLRKLMAAPLADGACAIVLTSPARAAELKGEPRVLLGGIGLDLSTHAPGDRDLTRWDGLRRAWERALATHGRPVETIDLATPSCLFPHEEELFDRALELGPDTRLSPDGGLHAGAVPIAAGLMRLAAAARGLRELGAGTAVAHGAWGPTGQGQAVALLEAA